MNAANFLSRIDRRTFMKILSFTGISGLIYPRGLFSRFTNPTQSRLVVVKDASATNGINSINTSTVQVMVDAGIKALAQLPDVGEAWKSLFPGIDSTKTIAIKVNCINSAVPTNPEVTYAVTNGLKQMNFGGTFFPENNIIIFDRSNGELSNAGYTINTSSTGIRCFGTSASGVGYGSQSYSVNGSSQKISNILETMADYLINISVLKNHGTAGVTLCLKNHYGTCHAPGSMHGNHADPYIPALNALPAIANKQMVNICDALYGVIVGGPGGQPQIEPQTIIMSRDIVAVDYWGREMLSEYGCSTIGQAHHVDTAAQAPYNLGTNDPQQMEIINIIDPTTGIPGNEPTAPDRFVLEQNHPNPFNNWTKIRFYLPREASARLEIFDTNGRQVTTILNGRLKSGWHSYYWGGTNSHGAPVASGLYICRLTAGSFRKSFIMQYVK